MISKFFILIPWLILAVAYTQDLKGFASRKQVPMGEPFELRYEINNTPQGKFIAPDLNGFLILQGPETVSQTINMNGKVHSSTVFKYILLPRAAGKYNIPPAKIGGNGTETVSNPVKIHVITGDAKHQEVAAAQQRVLKKLGQVQARLEISNSEPYTGEQLMVKLKLYHVGNISNLRLDTEPDWQGFWSVNLTSLDKYGIEKIDGEVYNYIQIFHLALYPQYSGEFKLGPYVMRASAELPVIREMENDPFALLNQMMGYSPNMMVQIPLKTEAGKLNVRPVPLEGKPEGFDGAVGSYRMQVEMPQTAAKTGEPVVMAVEVRGSGDLNNFPEPVLRENDSLRIFSPETDEFREMKIDTVTGIRRYWWTFVPLQPGNLSLPDIRFYYFDPSREAYDSLVVPRGARLSVTGKPITETFADAVTDSAMTTEETPVSTGLSAITSENDSRNLVLIAASLAILPFIFLGSITAIRFAGKKRTKTVSKTDQKIKIIKNLLDSDKQDEAFRLWTEILREKRDSFSAEAVRQISQWRYGHGDIDREAVRELFRRTEVWWKKS